MDCQNGAGASETSSWKRDDQGNLKRDNQANLIVLIGVPVLTGVTLEILQIPLMIDTISRMRALVDAQVPFPVVRADVSLRPSHRSAD